MTHITNIRNEKRGLTVNPMYLKKVIRKKEFCGQLSVYKIDNLDEKDEFLETHNYKITQGEIDN